jgi:NADPH-dependent 2,4-dienoyl-CoA reductase/sulfur reductase-like enzyme
MSPSRSGPSMNTTRVFSTTCTHEVGWIPKNNDFYDLVVIGGGIAGLVTAAGSAGVGARVAMIEAHLLGGDWYVRT